jgi:hypothetical protein
MGLFGLPASSSSSASDSRQVATDTGRAIRGNKNVSLEGWFTKYLGDKASYTEAGGITVSDTRGNVSIGDTRTLEQLGEAALKQVGDTGKSALAAVSDANAAASDNFRHALNAQTDLANQTADTIASLVQDANTGGAGTASKTLLWIAAAAVVLLLGAAWIIGKK